MAAVTQIRGIGLPGRPYGSFAGKVEGDPDPGSPRAFTQRYTRLRGVGLATQPFGAFSGKQPADPNAGHPRPFKRRLTQLRGAALPFQPFGSFIGKTPADVAPTPVMPPSGGGSSRRYRRRRILVRVIDGIRFVGDEESLDRLAGRIEERRETAALEHELPGIPPEATTLRATDFLRFDPLVSVPKKVGTDSRVLKRFVRELRRLRAEAAARRDEDEAVAILLLRRP